MKNESVAKSDLYYNWKQLWNGHVWAFIWILDLNFINGFEGGYVNYLVSRNSSLLRKNGQDVRSAPNFVLVKETMVKTIELPLGLILCLRIA